MRALLALALFSIALAGCTSAPSPSSPTSPSTGGGGSQSGTPSSTQVQAIGGEQGNLFQPNQTSIKAGQQVTWTGQSGHHTVTFQTQVNGNGTAPDSGDLGPGQTYALTFPTPGTYEYRCRYHSSDFGAGKGMTGSVTVT